MNIPLPHSQLHTTTNRLQALKDRAAQITNCCNFNDFQNTSPLQESSYEILCQHLCWRTRLSRLPTEESAALFFQLLLVSHQSSRASPSCSFLSLLTLGRVAVISSSGQRAKYQGVATVAQANCPNIALEPWMGFYFRS